MIRGKALWDEPTDGARVLSRCAICGHVHHFPGLVWRCSCGWRSSRRRSRICARTAGEGWWYKTRRRSTGTMTGRPTETMFGCAILSDERAPASANSGGMATSETPEVTG